MDLSTLKKSLLAKPGATEDAAFGPEHLTYKVCGKLFAVVSWDEDPMKMSIKCDPAKVEILRKVFTAVQPPPYFNKKHWNLVVLDGSVPTGELEAMVDESCDLVVRKLTKKERATLSS